MWRTPPPPVSVLFEQVESTARNEGAASNLADGGAGFLAQVQDKANFLSLLWMGVAAVFAAFGGGWRSVDRGLLRKEF